jgi:hypothetical protein
MKVMYFLAALLLAPAFATHADAHIRIDGSRHATHAGAPPTLANRRHGYGIEGREIAAPPWSFACTNDAGPRQCDEPMWVYGSPDYVAQFKNAF